MNDEETHSSHLLNEKTVVVTAAVPPSAAALGPRQAFLVAYERLATLAAVASGAAFVAVVVDGRARVVGSCLVPAETALVVGRHTECGLHLLAPEASLRQIAVLARSHGEHLFVHVWDLMTEQPFSIEDGTVAAALVANGPTFLSVLEYSMWIISADALVRLPASANEAWDSLPSRRLVDVRPPGERPPSRPALVPQRRTAPPPSLELTHVTVVTAPLYLHDGHEPEIVWGALRLASGEWKARYPVSVERLGRGVLIGRYLRCGISIADLDRVSRVHLLVVRIGEDVWAIDTASTNGVERRGEKLSAAILEDGDRLDLAKLLSATWTREVHPSA